MLIQPSPIKIVLADDDEVFRSRFRSIITQIHSINLLGEAENGAEMFEKIHCYQPDVVLTNIDMFACNGIDITKRIIKLFPPIKVIALSRCKEERTIAGIIGSGAKGYLQKTAHNDEIIAAVKSVFKDIIYHCKSTSKTAARMIDKSSYYPGKKMAKIKFTPNEITVIKMICEQLVSKEMAARLGLSKRTVEGYREQIMKKINARSPAGIVIYAIENKIFRVKVVD